MRFARVRSDAGRPDIVVDTPGGWLPVRGFAGFEDVTSVARLVDGGRWAALERLLGDRQAAPSAVPLAVDAAGTIADRDRDIWGVGLNYLRHATDLDAEQPKSGPGSYLRPGNCLIDNGGVIELPEQSRRVTAEAELALVIGRRCKNVSAQDWRSVVAGVTGVVDVTAEDVIRENPRYIPWAKGFDTFCSVGPVLVTMDDVDDDMLQATTVATVRNGETVAEATPSDMKYGFSQLIEYFTAGRTLEAGTVVCTGTPGAAVISGGDTVCAAVEGVGMLTHPVR